MGPDIRIIEPSDYPLLEEFLYHAIWVPPDTAPLPRDIIYEPDIFVYIDGFGGRDDFGFVAEQDNRVVGAAWARIISAFGYIDDETPELALSVLPEYRGGGIGSLLLTHLLDLLCQRGYYRVSLSVQKENPAVRLYLRLGFETASENDDDYLMVKKFPPERMGDFFDTRADIYDDHMNVAMELDEFYEAVADLLKPPSPVFRLLDLGCGTGLELERLFERFPDMQVTGIDLSRGMLEKLQAKFPDKPMNLICGSYLDRDFGSEFDVVLSTYSLHHFSETVKRELYRCVHTALKSDGVFLYGDFTAASREQQDVSVAEAARIRQGNNLSDDECYHLDMPFTAENEMRLMRAAGFKDIQLARQWNQASVIIARK